MPGQLAITVGQYSDKGRKATNQDFHGALIPAEPLLGMKGIAVCLADGISSSDVGHIASESAVKSFLTDYYCTSESWSVKTSAQRVIAAVNSWLNAQTRHGRHESDRGYVCTFSALVLKAATAHVFHVGDARIYRVAGDSLEQLTEDHRVVLSSEESYLGRALGVNAQVEIDYRSLPVRKGDTFLLTTDGVHEHVSARFAATTIANNAGNLDAAAKALVETAYQNNSKDNLTVQIIRIDDVPDAQADDLLGRIADLPPPPLPEARATLDGYQIVRELHGSSRSHIYLAVDPQNEELVALKIPSIDLRGDPAYLKRFMMEEWVARRINSPHVIKPRQQSRRPNYLYVVMEYVDGQTLRQWMIDNRKPDLETVRGLVEQIARGIGAFHRREMLHQDLRPENIIIDKTGTAKIIDFGATRIAGVAETLPDTDEDEILGTQQYTAPEYFLGEGGSQRSDQFSLAVIAYEMLTGALPYGAQIAKARTKTQFRKLRYRPATGDNSEIPAWFDRVLEKAVNPDPAKRYEELSEFVHQLRYPGPEATDARPKPLLERNPQLFWKCLSMLLGCTVFVLLALLLRGR